VAGPEWWAQRPAREPPLPQLVPAGAARDRRLRDGGQVRATCGATQEGRARCPRQTCVPGVPGCPLPFTVVCCALAPRFVPMRPHAHCGGWRAALLTLSPAHWQSCGGSLKWALFGPYVWGCVLYVHARARGGWWGPNLRAAPWRIGGSGRWCSHPLTPLPTLGVLPQVSGSQRNGGRRRCGADV